MDEDEERQGQSLERNELLEAILQRLNEPLEVVLTVHVVNESHPAVKVVLEPETPQTN